MDLLPASYENNVRTVVENLPRHRVGPAGPVQPGARPRLPSARQGRAPRTRRCRHGSRRARRLPRPAGVYDSVRQSGRLAPGVAVPGPAGAPPPPPPAAKVYPAVVPRQL